MQLDSLMKYAIQAATETREFSQILPNNFFQVTGIAEPFQ